MKVAILAGGKGTRLAPHTNNRPKSAVEIGGHPILWHIMKHYASYDHTRFVIAVGHQSQWFRSYFQNGGANTAWNVELVDTGATTATGGRLKRLARRLGGGTFMLTYCDGLSNVNLDDLLTFHRSHGKLATVTAIHPPSRFGHFKLEGDRVSQFCEKPLEEDRWINGAFFVLEPEAISYIDGDDTRWEKEPMERLAAVGQLMAYRHESFWQCMDTPKDRQLLEQLWQSGQAAWKTWEGESCVSY